MKKLTTIVIFLILTSLGFSQSQDTLFVAFWNMENLFDVIDDPNKSDEEFLPSGDKEWTAERLDKKLYNHARIIRLMNNGEGPDILGVCEVEHQHLLDTLISKFLPEKNYKVAYRESPDNRGIDNGLIYNSNLFKLTSVKADTVFLPDLYPTRLILNVNLIYKGENISEEDTLRFFVNHWPSRRGGEQESESNRITAANTLRKMVDEYFVENPDAKIFIMGDFNDEPTNNSILKSLNANPFNCKKEIIGDEFPVQKQLFNLSYQTYEDGLGTYKYRDDWNMLDQIIVSGSILTGDDIKYICNTFTIFKPEILVEQTGKYKGTPFPTYGGRRYLGGYSDHFPVFAKFIINGDR